MSLELIIHICELLLLAFAVLITGALSCASVRKELCVALAGLLRATAREERALIAQAMGALSRRSSLANSCLSMHRFRSFAMLFSRAIRVR